MNHINRIMSVLLLALTALPAVAVAQEDTIVSHSGDLSLSVPSSERSMHPLADKSSLTGDTLKRWEYSIAMGAAYVGGTYTSASVFGITPTILFRPNDRLKIKASFTGIDSYSLLPNGYNVGGSEVRNLAPVRNHSNTAVGVNVAASYKINERLTIAASLMHLSGQLASASIVNPWIMSRGPIGINATAFSAAMRYRIGDDSFLDLHMTIIDDRTGILGPFYPYGLNNCWGSPFYYHNTTIAGQLF